MGKRIFLLIIILMSIALIGIISVQVFWIKNTIQITEEQFSSNVKFALAKVSEDVRNREFTDFYLNFAERYKEGEQIKGSDIRKFIYEKLDTTNNERFTYSQSIIEQNYKVPTEFFDIDTTINFTEVYSKQEVVIVKEQVLDNETSALDSPEERYEKFGR